MATTPNLNPTDPWTLAQKFLDNQNAEFRQQASFDQRDKELKAAREQKDKDEAFRPIRRYNETRSVGQANIENAKDAEAAGLGTGGSRYRSGKVGPNDPEIFNEFMEGVKEKGLTNPYGLAAVAGTGQIESGFSKGNLHRKWSDPSESGQAGTSGLLMSWRGDRLAKAIQYGRQNGEEMPSARTQGRFLADENPQMVQELQNAGSLAEAQKIINKNWRFAGWDTGGGSSKARLDASSAYLKQFGANPMTAKDRNAAGAQLAQTTPQDNKKIDVDGREYFEVQMDADGFRKVQAGMPGAREKLVVDPTKPVGPRGQVVVKQYTGVKAPVAPTTTPNIPVPAATAQAPTVKPMGYDGSEDEL